MTATVEAARQTFLRPHQRGRVVTASGDTKFFASASSPNGLAAALSRCTDFQGKGEKLKADLATVAKQLEGVDIASFQRILSEAGLTICVVESFTGKGSIGQDPGSEFGPHE